MLDSEPRHPLVPLGGPTPRAGEIDVAGFFADPVLMERLFGSAEDLARRRPGVEAYLRALGAGCASLDLSWVPAASAVPSAVDLESIYLPPRAWPAPPGIPPTWIGDGRGHGRWEWPCPTGGREAALREEAEGSVDLASWARARPAVAVLGEAGSGKTTFLRWQAWEAATGRGPDHRFPILVPMGALARFMMTEGRGLEDFLPRWVESVGGVDLSVELARAFESGAALVLFDGLSEVDGLTPRLFAGRFVGGWMADHLPKGNRCILTSRPEGYRLVAPAVKGLAECSLGPFDSAWLDRLAERWTGACFPPAATAPADRRRAPEGCPGMETPLLRMLEAVGWETGRGNQLRRLLLPGAGIRPRSDEAGETWRNLLRSQARGTCEMEPRFVQEARAAWALVRQVGPGPDRWLAELGEDWVDSAREPLALLVFEAAAEADAEEGRAGSTLDFLLAGPPDLPPGEGAVRAGRWAGLVGLPDYPGGVGDRIRQALARVMREPARVHAGARVAAGDVLGRLGDNRPGVVPRSLRDLAFMEFCHVVPGSFLAGPDGLLTRDDSLRGEGYWVGRYPVTVAQFRWFVAEGGYHEVAWWEEAVADGVWKDGRVLSLGRIPGETGWRWEWRNRPRDHGAGSRLPNHPVTGVTWYEACAFSRWLGDRVPVPGPGAWRIPASAEWQKAARGGRRIPMDPVIRTLAAGLRPAAWPDLAMNPLPERSQPWGVGMGRNSGHADAGGPAGTTAVGCFPGDASPYGAEDLAGNVWEWCWDRSEGRPSDRLLAGGRWQHEGVILGGIGQDAAGPAVLAEAGIGFRVAWLPAPPEGAPRLA